MSEGTQGAARESTGTHYELSLSDPRDLTERQVLGSYLSLAQAHRVAQDLSTRLGLNVSVTPNTLVGERAYVVAQVLLRKRSSGDIVCEVQRYCLESTSAEGVTLSSEAPEPSLTEGVLVEIWKAEQGWESWETRHLPMTWDHQVQEQLEAIAQGEGKAARS